MKRKKGFGFRVGALLAAAILIASLVSAQPGASAEAGGNWGDVALKIEAALVASLETYEGGDSAGGVEGVSDAYFEVFEGSEANMEIAVRRFVSVKAARELEGAFKEIRKGMHKGVEIKTIKKMVAGLISDIKEAARALDDKGVGYDVGY